MEIQVGHLAMQSPSLMQDMQQFFSLSMQRSMRYCFLGEYLFDILQVVAQSDTLYPHHEAND
jgi:hypothetical protein